MTTPAHHDSDDEPATIDDLRVIVREIRQCQQLGDAAVVGEARTALLRVLLTSAARLTERHKGVLP